MLSHDAFLANVLFEYLLDESGKLTEFFDGANLESHRAK